MRPRVLLLLLPLCAVPAAFGQDRTTPPPGRPAEGARLRAIAAGLDYLADEQREDGSWGDPERGMIGITSLCLLAFMAQGHQEGRGRYSAYVPQGSSKPRDVLRKGINFLLAHSTSGIRQGKPPGYIFDEKDGDSRMHGHGYATQVLVLAYGAGPTESERAAEMRRKIRMAIDVIEDSQTITGGWGYQPFRATPHEGSVTVTVVQALRLAADAGFTVDREVHERGLKYLRDSQKSDGSFKYSHTSEISSAALTAAALTAMHGFGEYYSSAVDRGLEYLEDSYTMPSRVQWPYYAHYYAAQAFYVAGGRHWQFWDMKGTRYILQEQHAGGYWDDKLHPEARRGSHGRHYATAFSVLALSVPDGFLPLFQR